jgi:hypothetical protein
MRGRGESYVDKPESVFDVEEEGSEEEGDILVCEQCYNAVDTANPDRTSRAWEKTEDGSSGLNCCEIEKYRNHRDMRFCSRECIEMHLNGDHPPWCSTRECPALLG